MCWSLSAQDVEHTVASALRRRAANRRPGQDTSHLPAVWSSRCDEARSWPFRTHFAVLLTGLLAKAADAHADPRSLKTIAGPTAVGRFNAANVWKAFYDRAVPAGLDLGGLKAAPHNNQPYMSMKYIDGTTDSTRPATRLAVKMLHSWLTELNEYDQASAQDALDAFLLRVPDFAKVHEVALGATRDINPAEVFDAVTDFINADTENGRRGQALLAACLSLVHGDDVETPSSINDPSRNSLGDATIRQPGKLLGAESKQRIVTAAEVRNTAKELHRREPNAALMYGAFVNAEDGKPLSGQWRDYTKETGTVVVVHDDPASLLRDAIVWSAMPFPIAVVSFATKFYLALAHIDVRATTLEEWLHAAAEFGVDVQQLSESSSEPETPEEAGYRSLAADPEQQAAQAERRAHPRRIDVND